MDDSIKKPNFFIIGAPKCGTTSLYYYLKDHPDIFMAEPKEPHYFSTDFSDKFRKVLTREDYLNLFKEAKKYKAVGEGSTEYLYSKEAVPNILKFNSEAKFIVMVRNPIELVISLHQELFVEMNENIEDVEKAWDLQEKRRINDRMIIRLENDKVFALYGVSLISNRIEALTAKEISFDSKGKIKTKRQGKIVARRTVKEYLRSRLSSEPVLTYRPGGSVIKKGKNYVVIPVQATRDRSYGECLALVKINFERFRIESKEFLFPEEFSKNYEKIHHLSPCQGDKNVYAMDYQTEEESWQVGIYVNPK